MIIIIAYQLPCLLTLNESNIESFRNYTVRKQGWILHHGASQYICTLEILDIECPGHFPMCTIFFLNVQLVRHQQ